MLRSLGGDPSYLSVDLADPGAGARLAAGLGDVQTLQGVVWLRGHVPSEAARSDAELLARTTDGVLAVRNRLDVVTR